MCPVARDADGGEQPHTDSCNAQTVVMLLATLCNNVRFYIDVSWIVAEGILKYAGKVGQLFVKPADGQTLMRELFVKPADGQT